MPTMRPMARRPSPGGGPRGKPKGNRTIIEKETTRNRPTPASPQSSFSSSSHGSRIRLKNSSTRSPNSFISPSLPPDFGTRTIQFLSSRSSHVLHFCPLLASGLHILSHLKTMCFPSSYPSPNHLHFSLPSFPIS